MQKLEVVRKCVRKWLEKQWMQLPTVFNSDREVDWINHVYRCRASDTPDAGNDLGLVGTGLQGQGDSGLTSRDGCCVG